VFMWVLGGRLSSTWYSPKKTVGGSKALSGTEKSEKICTKHRLHPVVLLGFPNAEYHIPFQLQSTRKEKGRLLTSLNIYKCFLKIL
jgi:hypothetical protein